MISPNTKVPACFTRKGLILLCRLVLSVCLHIARKKLERIAAFYFSIRTKLGVSQPSPETVHTCMPPRVAGDSGRGRRSHHARRQALRLGGQHGGRPLHQVRGRRRAAGGTVARPAGEPRVGGPQRQRAQRIVREKRERTKRRREVTAGRLINTRVRSCASKRIYIDTYVSIVYLFR